jgi:factor associated with neutral sphingomyelinase activation
MNSAGGIVFSVSSDGSLKVYDLQKSRQIRSIKISQLALSSCALTADEKNVLIGSWDNHVYIYNVDYSRVTDTVYAHGIYRSEFYYYYYFFIFC